MTEHVLFSNYDRKYWVYQPNIVRWRHRYQGVRESLKLNQEMGQTYYDINKTELRMDAVEAALTSYKDSIENGVDIDDLEFWNSWEEWDEA